MTKELLQIEFRYRDAPKSDLFSGHESKMVTIGIFDTIEEAVASGNKAIESLNIKFKSHPSEIFKVKGVFGHPNRLVANPSKTTRQIEYYAKVTKLTFDDLSETANETFAAFERYKAHRAKNEQ